MNSNGIKTIIIMMLLLFSAFQLLDVQTVSADTFMSWDTVDINYENFSGNNMFRNEIPNLAYNATISQIELYVGTSSTATIVGGLLDYRDVQPKDADALHGAEFQINPSSYDTEWVTLTLTHPFDINPSNGSFYLYFGPVGSSSESGKVSFGVDYYSSGNQYPLELGDEDSATIWANESGGHYKLNMILLGTRWNNITQGTASQLSTPDLNITAFQLKVGYISELTDIGFWLSENSTLLPGFEATAFNYTYGTITIPSTYTHSAWVKWGEYYYWRCWLDNSGGFTTPGNESYYLTKPSVPSNLQITANATNMTLSWTNGIAAVTNRTTVIRYATSSYPADINEGTSVYNGTGTSTTLNGLNPSTTYYFSAYTYINASGSPYLWTYSNPTLGLNTTLGGTYNITVRWECNDTLVNLSVINGTFYAKTFTGEILNQSNPTNVSGAIMLTTTEQIDVMTLVINETTGTQTNSYQRSVIIGADQENVTIYLPCGEIGAQLGDISEITIHFLDSSGTFDRDHHAYAYLYRFNGSQKEYIDMDFIQADGAMRSYLIKGASYYLGISCDSFSDSNMGKLTIMEDEYFVSVYHNQNQTIWMGDVLNVSKGRTLALLYLDVFDRTHIGSEGIYNATIDLFYTSNDTLIETVYATTPWDFNYTYLTTNSSIGYHIELTVKYSKGENNATATLTYIYLGYYDTIIDDPSTIDDAITDVYGISPVNFEGQVIAWTSLGAAAAALLILLILSREFAGIALMAMGFVLALFKSPLGLITDDVMNWMVVTVLVLLGILTMIALKRED